MLASMKPEMVMLLPHAPSHFSTLLHVDILGKFIWSRLPAALSIIFSSFLHRSNF